MRNILSLYKMLLAVTMLLLLPNSLVSQVYHGTISDYKIGKLATESGLSQSSVLSMYQDKLGFIWFGTKDGLNRYDGYGFDVFKSISSDANTISSNEIICITSDANNNLYIGTRGGGMNKIITAENRVVRIESGVSSNGTINGIYFDQDSILWVCAEEGLIRGVPNPNAEYGFDFVNVVKKSVYRDINGNIMPQTKYHLATSCIYQMSENTFFVGTDLGLFMYRLNESTFQMLDVGFFFSGRINAILKYSEAEYFVASANGLYCCQWDGNSLKTKISYNNYQSEEHQLRSSWVNVLLKDKSNTIWGGTRGGGLFSIDSSLTVINYAYNDIGVNSISDKIINSLLIDKSGVLWVGTETRGCNTLNLNRRKFCQFDDIPNFDGNLSSDVVTAITGNKSNELYVGSAYYGVKKITLNDDSYSIVNVPLRSFNSSIPAEVLSLYYDSKDNLWISSLYNSIIKIDKKGKYSEFMTPGFVFSIFEDSKRNLWIGTWGGGFCKIDTETGVLLPFTEQNSILSISSDCILSFAEDTSGNMWIGTRGGGVNVASIDFLERGLSNFGSYKFDPNDPKSLSNNDVYCIYNDSRGNIWLGTGSGLNRFVLPVGESPIEAIMKNKGYFEHYSVKDGLPSANIRGIIEDNNGFLWISTTNGLARLNLDDHTIVSFSKNDGLQDNEFRSRACFRDNNGQIYFGGINGITFFNPDDINTSLVESKTQITGLKVQNKYVKPNQLINGNVLLDNDISVTDKIVLLPKYKDFALEFSSMNYTNIDNVRYAYRLKGYTDEWTITNRFEHLATYTNISEGKYIFQVKATNSDGSWSDNITELAIVVKPELWRSPCAIIFYLCLVFLLLFVFRKYSIIGVKEKNRLRIEAYEKQKAIEITESKMRFYTNISHEIRTPLTLIYTPIDDILNMSGIDENIRYDLTLVKKNVDRLMAMTNKLLELRKIDMGISEPNFECVHFVPYINDIFSYFEQQFRNKRINATISCNLAKNDDKLWIDKEMITTAIYNLISNACKYTPTQGSISLKVFVTTDKSGGLILSKKSIDYLNIEISDTGIGIPENEVSQIFERFYQASNHAETGQAGSGIGLAVVKEYVDLHKGIVKANSQVGVGTTITIMLPMGSEHVKKAHDIAPETDDETVTTTPVDINKQKVINEQLPTILIVEDDLEMLSLLERHFEQNYNVFTATDGKKAWNIIQNRLPDMVISDIMMPEIDGGKLCNMIKTDIETSHIPVILLSAQANNEDIIKGYEKGADSYISKPFAMSILDAQVSQLLATRKQLIDIYSQKIFLKPREIAITNMDEKFLTKIMDIIEENIADTDFDVSTIVSQMNMSHSSVLKKIKALTGVSLVEFVRKHRLNKAAMILKQEKISITEVAYMTGFSDPKYFSKCFSKQFGKTPTEFVNEAFAQKSNNE